MNFIIVTRGRIPERELNKYKFRILFNKGNKYALLANDLKSFIDFLLETDKVNQVLHRDKYVSKEEFLQQYLNSLIELQNRLSVKYQKIYAPSGEVIGAEFFCNFPVHPYVLYKALSETCFADLKCLKSVIERVKEREWDKLIFVNLFPQSVEKADFIITATAEIINRGLTEQFVLEVLEYQLAEENVKRNINFVKKQGIKVAVDDWGSESAGIYRVVNLKPDFVKIDKSITWNREARELIEPLIPRFQEKGINIIVEGIENEEHYEWAKKLNAYMQGFYLHRPEPF